MKVNIFDYYDQNTQNLIQSLKTAQLNRQSLFVHYDGELPEGALSPFTFFTKVQETNRRGLFFNRVPVPEFYDIIVGGANSARIQYDGRTAGLITFRREGYRLVDNVVWYSAEDGDKVIKKDFYNIAGIHFATTYFQDGEEYETKYFHEDTTVITENHDSGIIKLQYQGQVHDFANLTMFFSYFLQEAKIDPTDIVINSLSYPLFIAHLLNNQNTTLFWQEPLADNVPGNMVGELEQRQAVTKIIFGNQTQLNQVANQFPQTAVQLAYLSNIGEFVRETQYRPRAFVLTNSDDLRGLNEILTRLPQLHVTVAAFTEMSKKLLDQGDQHQNLRLLPSFSPRGIQKELADADIYLDINAGGKVGNIMREAYQNHMLILTDQNVKTENYKSLDYQQTSTLIADLIAILSDQNMWQAKLEQLISQNGPLSTAADYQKLLS